MPIYLSIIGIVISALVMFFFCRKLILDNEKKWEVKKTEGKSE